MNKTVSRSPDRNTFQKENYIKRCIEEGKTPREDYLKLYEDEVAGDIKWSEQEHPDDMEWCLRTTDWILEKVRSSDSYAQNLYAAMCNNGFIQMEVFPILKGEEWSCSWRSAGGIIANMQKKGDYIDWYCSGIRNTSITEDENKLWDDKGYVPEGCITDEIQQDLQRLGWVVAPDGDWQKFI